MSGMPSVQIHADGCAVGASLSRSMRATDLRPLRFFIRGGLIAFPPASECFFIAYQHAGGGSS